MVKIRLTRTGTKKRPCYRVIAIDERRQRDGRPIDYLGLYDPKPEPPTIDLQTEKIQAWVARGAQLSPAVKSLVRRSRAAAPAAGGAS